MKKYTPGKTEAYQKLSLLCSRQEKSTFDIQKKLTDWQLAKEDIENIIAHLLEEKFIDDERYAFAYCKDRFTFGGWGEYKIRTALKQKQIAQRIIDAALEQIEGPKYKKQLEDLLIKKNKGLKIEEDAYKRKAKLYRYALSKGYGHELIMKILDTMFD